MHHLRLYFEGPVPELVRIEFSHPLLPSSRIAKRGRGLSSAKECSFPWTNAVRGFCALIIEWALSLHRGCGEVVIEGHRGSLAASLDLAITKQPQWIKEIFGCDSMGHSLIRRLLIRKNTELRRPGPVGIHILEGARSGIRPEIFLNQLQCTKEKELRVILSSIIGEDTLATVQTNSEMPTLSLIQYFEKEIAWALRAVDIVVPGSSSASNKRLWANRAFAKFAGKPRHIFAEDSLRLSSAELLGLHPRSCHQLFASACTGSFKIAAPGSCIGALIVLEKLRITSNGIVDTNFLFAHGGEVLSSILEKPQEYQGAVLTMGQVANVLAQGERSPIVPLMLLPPTSFELLTPQFGSEKLSGEWAFLDDGPTSSRIAFDELTASFASSQRPKILPCAPGLLPRIIANANENLKVLTWFPFSVIIKDVLDAKRLHVTAPQALSKDNFLCVRRELLENKELLRLLDTGIRESWLTLLESDTERKSAVSKLLGSSLYRKALRRWSGIHALDPQQISNRSVYINEL